MVQIKVGKGGAVEGECGTGKERGSLHPRSELGLGLGETLGRSPEPEKSMFLRSFLILICYRL